MSNNRATRSFTDRSELVQQRLQNHHITAKLHVGRRVRSRITKYRDQEGAYNRDRVLLYRSLPDTASQNDTTNPPTIFERFRRKSTHDFDTISTYDFENDFETLPNDFGYDFETHL